MFQKLFFLVLFLVFSVNVYATTFVGKGLSNESTTDIPVGFYIDNAAIESNLMYTKTYTYSAENPFTVGKITNAIRSDLTKIKNYQDGVTAVMAVGTTYGSTWKVVAEEVSVENGFIVVHAVVYQNDVKRGETDCSLFALEYSLSNMRDQMVAYRDYIKRREDAGISDFVGVVVTPL